MVSWNFRFIRKKDYHLKFIREVGAIFEDGFSYEKPWDLEGLGWRIRESQIVGQLKNKEGELLGCCFFSIPQKDFLGGHILWENAICLKRKVQGLGFSRKLVDEVSKEFPLFNFLWYGGRTQNPVVLKRYGSQGELFPFDHSYQNSEGKFLMNFLMTHINEVQKMEKFNPLTGIGEQVYEEGLLGKYPTSLPETEKYENYLSKNRFVSSRGDAVVVIAKLLPAFSRTLPEEIALSV